MILSVSSVSKDTDNSDRNNRHDCEVYCWDDKQQGKGSAPYRHVGREK